MQWGGKNLDMMAIADQAAIFAVKPTLIMFAGGKQLNGTKHIQGFKIGKQDNRNGFHTIS